MATKTPLWASLLLGLYFPCLFRGRKSKKTIHKLAEKEYAIIYITEEASLKAKESLAKYKDMELPAIIVIPGIGGSMGLGMNEVRESAKRAIGADILFSE